MTLAKSQLQYLAAPSLPSQMVSTRDQAGRTLSYVSAYQIKAALTRVFGYGNWDWQIVEAKAYSNTVFQVHGRLTVRFGEGESATYDGVAVGEGRSGQDAADTAVKTADSEALKRAASNLGTQFGLSLYNGGSTTDVVGPVWEPTQGLILREKAAE